MLMLLIALASILYGSAAGLHARPTCGWSPDTPRVAQLGFITLGIFALNAQGAQGALLQMVNHGLVVAPLLFIVALLVATRRWLARTSARWAASRSARRCSRRLFLIVALATLAMPGSANFVGEFLILLGVFKPSS